MYWRHIQCCVTVCNVGVPCQPRPGAHATCDGTAEHLHAGRVFRNAASEGKSVMAEAGSELRWNLMESPLWNKAGRLMWKSGSKFHRAVELAPVKFPCVDLHGNTGHWNLSRQGLPRSHFSTNFIFIYCQGIVGDIFMAVFLRNANITIKNIPIKAILLVLSVKT